MDGIYWERVKAAMYNPTVAILLMLSLVFALGGFSGSLSL